MRRLAFALPFTALLGGQAAAHATLEVRSAEPNSIYKAVLRVPHGCDGQATETVSVRIPEGMISVKPMPKPGWTLETVRAPYAETYDYHGPKTEGVVEIRWTDGMPADDHDDEFVFRGRLTDFAPGTALAFPAVQTCADGEVAWVELAAEGQDPHDLKRPAPLLTIADAVEGHSGHGGHASHGGHAAAGDEADAAGTGSAKVGSVMAGDLKITNAWTRATPPRAAAGGGYLTIENTGETDDVLIAGAAPISERVEIHEMAVNDGLMTMARLEDGLPIPAGETVMLKPGGFHVMFMGLTDAPVEGETVDVVLTFRDAGEVTVTMPVAAVGATDPHARH